MTSLQRKPPHRNPEPASRPPLTGDAWEGYINSQWLSATEYAYGRASELASVYPDATPSQFVKLFGVDYEEAMEMTAE